jgi:hypothetical protein
MSIVTLKKFMGLLIALLASNHAIAVDGLSVELGRGNATDTARIGAIWDFNQSWFTDGDWQVTGFWEATAGTWRGHSNTGGNHIITELGLSPVFRFQEKHPVGIAPYLEGSIGFHLIDLTYIYNNRKFGSAFQFGDHLGFGVRFGEQQQFDLGYRLQHLSNGGIKQPNQGINFSQIHFSYHF